MNSVIKNLEHYLAYLKRCHEQQEEMLREMIDEIKEKENEQINVG